MNEYTSKGGVARAHIDNGNLKDNGSLTFVYDYKNRLVGAFDKATNNPVAAYLYYCDNRRAKKIVYSQTSPGVIDRQERFFYDGQQVVEEADDAGNTLLTWVYSPVYVDEPVQYVRTSSHSLGAGTFYLHQNARADVVAVTDGAGTVVERRLYDDFGRSFDGTSKAPVSGSVVGNVYGFQGRRLDAETGLYYFRARYYDPSTGRFVQRDPVWDPGNFGNQYSFVGASPASGRDPMGDQADPAFRGLERAALSGDDAAYAKLKQEWRRQGKMTQKVQRYISKLDTWRSDVGRHQRWVERANHQDVRRKRFLQMAKRAEGMGMKDAAARYTQAAKRRLLEWQELNNWANDARKDMNKSKKALNKAHSKLSAKGRAFVSANRTLDIRLRTLKVLSVLSGVLLARAVYQGKTSLKRMNHLVSLMKKGNWRQVACLARSRDFRANFNLEYAALGQQAGPVGQRLATDVVTGKGDAFLDNLSRVASHLSRKKKRAAR